MTVVGDVRPAGYFLALKLLTKTIKKLVNNLCFKLSFNLVHKCTILLIKILFNLFFNF